MQFKSKNWWNTTSSNIVGTVVGIIITFGVGVWVDYNNRKKDREISSVIIVENLIERADMLHNFFKRAAEYEPRMKKIIEMTPQDVKEMPEDSVTLYLWGFALHAMTTNDFGRNIFNSDLDILRSADNYKFILFVDDAYGYLDGIQDYYATSGPLSLSPPLQDLFFKEIEKQHIVNTTSRWELLQIVESPLMKFQIKQYLENFCPYIPRMMEKLEEFKRRVHEISGISEKELKEFSEEYNRYKFL